MFDRFCGTASVFAIIAYVAVIGGGAELCHWLWQSVLGEEDVT